jgi:hypothetical protein
MDPTTIIQHVCTHDRLLYQDANLTDTQSAHGQASTLDGEDEVDVAAAVHGRRAEDAQELDREEALRQKPAP